MVRSVVTNYGNHMFIILAGLRSALLRYPTVAFVLTTFANL